jgi:glc operon protein GlcG
MHDVPVLSHVDAMKLVGAVQAELERRQQGAAVAVVDSHGELMAMLRTDTCRLSCIRVAINKAYTAARERGTSKALGESAKRQDFPVTYFGDLAYVGWGGGVPIWHRGVVAGAIGVSGLTEEEDSALAQMAADLVSSR